MMRQFLMALFMGLYASQSTGTDVSPTDRGLPESLAQFAEQASGRDRLTALYLLAHVNLDQGAIERISKGCKVAHGQWDRLLCAYFLYGKTQSLSAADDFIEIFPTLPDKLAALFGDSLDIAMPTDLIDLLRNLAATDDTALKKLIVASGAADGWVAESLADALRDLNARNPARISAARREVAKGRR